MVINTSNPMGYRNYNPPVQRLYVATQEPISTAFLGPVGLLKFLYNVTLQTKQPVAPKALQVMQEL